MPEQPGAATGAVPKPVLLSEYRAPDFTIERVHLDFELDPERTQVRSRLVCERRPDADPNAVLELDGERLTLISIALDGQPLDPEAYTATASALRIPNLPDRFTLEIETEIEPLKNTELSGLYASSGTLCTQCEAEGFRRITYFLDRPDALSVFTTRLSADRAAYPVLLANGNPSGRGESGARHWAEWHDPFPKPAYLFALVAGDLACTPDRFRTQSGRDIELRLYVEHGDETKTGFALEALKRAMRWDEEVYGREYDLDVFMIVAVKDFNFGAMENKGLNIFNAAYVLASPESATDQDYANIEAIVAHEYFHNWTGNRVTLRDWFQLSLKEGLTVFRDQCFSADMQSAAVQRITDVKRLRARQFQEDAGPLAHPVQPKSYIEIDNFYTATVYEKGAELIRMLWTRLGTDLFRKGTDHYFARHDGRAATVEDLIRSMEDASGLDLGQFRRWYDLPGTPHIRAEGTHDPAEKTYTLALTQSLDQTSGGPAPEPLHIPLAMGLLTSDGQELPLRLKGEAEAGAPSRVFDLTQERTELVFEGVAERPIPSLLRGFSAPVELDDGLSPEEHAFLMGHDPDPFARWDAGRAFAARLLHRMILDVQAQRHAVADPAYLEAMHRTLTDARLDPAFRALALTLPSEREIALAMDVIDVDAIRAARQALRKALAKHLETDLNGVYQDARIDGPYAPTPDQTGQRALKNAALAALSALDEPYVTTMAFRQFEQSDNMTDTIGALQVLTDSGAPERAAAFDRFYERWKDDALVLDKWFALQAVSTRPETLEAVRALLEHPKFTRKNPNKVRSLIGSFANANQIRFHALDGGGYAFLATEVLELDGVNPSIAARLVTAFESWNRFAEPRASAQRDALKRICETPGLSRNVYEMASKALGASKG